MNRLDIEQLNELKEVLEEEFLVLIDTYLTDAELRLKLIEKGLNTNDYEQVLLAAHSLKGASANVGALILSELCEQLERHCKTGNYQPLQLLFREASDEFNEIAIILQKI